jgi:hypothetical protein
VSKEKRVSEECCEGEESEQREAYSEDIEVDEESKEHKESRACRDTLDTANRRFQELHDVLSERARLVGEDVLDLPELLVKR